MWIVEGNCCLDTVPKNGWFGGTDTDNDNFYYTDQECNTHTLLCSLQINQQHRYMLTDSDGNHRPFHHKARLHLRHLMSHHNHHDNGHHGNGHVKLSANGETRPRKNVSFADADEIAKSLDTDMGSTKAESGGENNDTSVVDVEDRGITFTVSDADDIDDLETVSDLTASEVEPTVAETTLPWKRTTGREVLPCSMCVSMPDDQAPLLGEAPSWVNNTEYTHPGSPPVGSPASQRASLDASRDRTPSPGLDNPGLDAPRVSHDTSDRDSTNSDLLKSSPRHDVGLVNGDIIHQLSDNRDLLSEQEDDNHERTRNHSGSVILPPPWKRIDEPTTNGPEEPKGSLGPKSSVRSASHPSSLSSRFAPFDTVDNSSLTAEDGIPPLPWRTNDPIEVNRDRGAPRPSINGGSSRSGSNNSSGNRYQASNEEPHMPPPPWRHTEPDTAMRSPSASHEPDAYSLRPQLSTLSFRLSEAESRHSELVHMHHTFDPPHPRPLMDLGVDYEDDALLDIETEEMDCYERVAKWLTNCEPEPLIDDFPDLPAIETPSSTTQSSVICLPSSSREEESVL